MAAAIAGLAADGPTLIVDADNVATPYPGFVDTLRTLGGHDRCRVIRSTGQVRAHAAGGMHRPRLS